jgi:hypothetical protein
MAAIPVLPSHICLGIIFLINMIFLFIGLGIVTPNLLSNSGMVMVIYPWPNFLYPITLTGGYLAAWYFFLVTAIVISVVWLVKQDGLDFIRIFVRSARKFNPPPFDYKNSIVLIFQFLFAIIFFNLLVIFILAMFGGIPSSPINGPEPVLWEWFYSLANASVAEEIVTKVLYIGLPLFLFDLLARRQKNKLHRYLIGGGFKIEPVTIVLIIFSSILFGLAHYPGWGLWKVAPTFMAGLAFGYLYVTKGIHTAIVLHFLIDYMVMVELFFIDNQTAFLVIALMLGLITLLWSISGSIYFSLFCYKISEKIMSGLSLSKPTPLPVGAPYYGPMGYGSGGHYSPNQYYSDPRSHLRHDHRSWGKDDHLEIAEERDDLPIQTQIRHANDSHSRSSPSHDQTHGHYNIPGPPPVPESERERFCPTCDTKLKYSQYANSYYCEKCLKYVF